MKPRAVALLAVCADCGRLLDILTSARDRSHFICGMPGHVETVAVRYVLDTKRARKGAKRATR